MTERTIVKSIEGHPDLETAFVVSGGCGIINKIPPVSKSLDIQKLPGIEVGDILKCDGNPYLSKGGATQSNPMLLNEFYGVRPTYSWKSKHKVVQVGEEAWAIRRKLGYLGDVDINTY